MLLFTLYILPYISVKVQLRVLIVTVNVCFHLFIFDIF